jgi:hypothetical protein
MSFGQEGIGQGFILPNKLTTCPTFCQEVKVLLLRSTFVRTMMLVGVVLLGLFFGLRSTASQSENAVNEMVVPAGLLEQTPVRIGEVEAADVTISYLDESSWRQEVHYADAAFIKVHLKQIDLKLGDRLVVSNPEGTHVHEYPDSGFTTDEGEGIWALSIVGDTVVLELVTGDSGDPVASDFYEKAAAGVPESDLGVRVDKFTRGYPEDVVESLTPDSTCGTNQRTDAVCYDDSHPVEFGKSAAVARVTLSSGAALCTAWRVTPQNFMLTNEHCITSQSQLNGLEFWFNYQRTECQSGGPAVPTIVAGDTFLIDNDTLDFALFTVDDFSSIQHFGYLEMEPRTPVLGEEIYLPQHGAGNPKEFGIESDYNPPNNLCQIDDAIRNGRGVNTDTGYFCDTTGGSSGSPVLARSTDKVIGLHHFGNAGAPNCDQNNMNGGVRIDLIYPLIESYFPEYAVAVSNSTMDDLPGSTVQHKFTVSNMGISDDMYMLGLIEGSWPITLLTPSPISVSAGMTGSVFVEVEIPHLEETLHETDVFTLTVDSESDPSVIDTGIGTTNSVTHSGIEASGSDDQQAPVGSVVTYTVWVTNTGDYTDAFSIDISGNAWPTVSQYASTGQLASVDSTSVEIYVTVMGSPSSDHFTVTFTSELDNNVTLSLDFTTEALGRVYLPLIMKPA